MTTIDVSVRPGDHPGPTEQVDGGWVCRGCGAESAELSVLTELGCGRVVELGPRLAMMDCPRATCRRPGIELRDRDRHGWVEFVCENGHRYKSHLPGGMEG